MHTERIVDDMDLAVIDHLADRLCLFQVAVFYAQGVVIKGFVSFIVVGNRIFLHAKVGQLFSFYQRSDLLSRRLAVMPKIF